MMYVRLLSSTVHGVTDGIELLRESTAHYGDVTEPFVHVFIELHFQQRTDGELPLSSIVMFTGRCVGWWPCLQRTN